MNVLWATGALLAALLLLAILPSPEPQAPQSVLSPADTMLASADTISELARIHEKNSNTISSIMRERRGTGADTSRWTYDDL